MDYFVSGVLRERRLEANLSQEELAARAEIDVRTVRRIETNKGASTQTLKKVCNVLKIGFHEAETDKVLEEYQMINLPNVKSGRDLAHLWIHCAHLDYYSDPADQLEWWENQVVEDFINTILEMMEVFEMVEAAERLYFIEKMDEELNKLSKQGYYIYGSCNDTLTNDFKMTELVFTKV